MDTIFCCMCTAVKRPFKLNLKCCYNPVALDCYISVNRYFNFYRVRISLMLLLCLLTISNTIFNIVKGGVARI